MLDTSVATVPEVSDRVFRGEDLIVEIKEMVEESGINTNDFYMTFRKKPLSPKTLRTSFSSTFTTSEHSRSSWLGFQLASTARSFA